MMRDEADAVTRVLVAMGLAGTVWSWLGAPWPWWAAWAPLLVWVALLLALVLVAWAVTAAVGRGRDDG